ncbi:MAG TPA: Txe/YoeB family addiction module toxin [Rhizomicrobium sp.]|nr:Txe/YoeB family addiction module toxin [Rhizomicrobium sp.]
MKVLFTAEAWEDYVHWQENDRDIARRVSELIKDMRRSPFRGIGKPEPLRGDLAGWWSRRITGDHRIIYRVSGKSPAQPFEIAACRYHY